MHQTRVDVVTVHRYVPETVTLHPVVTRSVGDWARLSEDERAALSSDTAILIATDETLEVAR